MKTNKEVIEEFEHTKFATSGGACFECCDFESMVAECEKFILSLRHQDLADIEALVLDKSFEIDEGRHVYERVVTVADVLALLKAKQKEEEE
jgi:hypothetical protein